VTVKVFRDLLVEQVKRHNTGGMGKKALEVHIMLCKAFARSPGVSVSEHSRSMVQ